MKTIKVILKNNDLESVEKYQAIIQSNKIIYNEKNSKVIIDYNNNFKMKRENSDYLIELEFINNKETKGYCIMKKENLKLELDISTDYIIIENNLIIIKYNVITTNQNVIYRMEIEE